jgi:hypothetical protein
MHEIVKWVIYYYFTTSDRSIFDAFRGLGVLIKQGWRPLRTIMFASWDAEEVCLCFYDG